MSIPGETLHAALVAWEANEMIEETYGQAMHAALEAAAPYLIADYLIALAADAKARGDIGNDEDGITPWDYLAWKAGWLINRATEAKES